MKKIFALLMICTLILTTGCGGSSQGEVKKPSNEPINLGMIFHLNITETLLDNYMEKFSAQMGNAGEIRKTKHVFFDNINSMIAALQAGQVEKISTYKSVADYLITQNKDFELVTAGVPKVSDSFCCAMREEDTELKTEFDAAIKKLTENGTLKNLVKTYIVDADFNKTPPAIEMPKFDGAKTIKIAVTGDLPPLDYVSADGKAAGFNTALLAEISKLIGKNFEPINVDSGARATALTSKQIDVVFWVEVPSDDTLAPPDCDKPEGVILTVPYFADEIAHVKLKE